MTQLLVLPWERDTKKMCSVETKKDEKGFLSLEMVSNTAIRARAAIIVAAQCCSKDTSLKKVSMSCLDACKKLLKACRGPELFRLG